MDDYLVCPHCMKVYRQSKSVMKFGARCCPNGDCTGTVMLSHPWIYFRKQCASLPFLPEVGAQYDLKTGEMIGKSKYRGG
jgi:hypothetical protein